MYSSMKITQVKINKVLWNDNLKYSLHTPNTNEIFKSVNLNLTEFNNLNAIY